LINSPKVIFGDEPTGALNSSTGAKVLDILTELNKEGQSIVMVTHDIKTAARANRLIYLKDGRIDGDLALGEYDEKDVENREDKIFEFIKSCSYPNNKAKHLLGMARMLVENFNGIVPDTMEELQKLPGVGRKTANVILSVAYQKPAMAVDTHVFRVAARIGLTMRAKNPYETEMQLIKYIPEEKIPFEEGIALSLEGLKPLGEEYLSIFREGVENGWIDIYENKGKRSGAYSSGAYDTEPYILLNYHEDLRDVSTLVHEMGHSIHSYYSRKYQPFVYGDYTLFVAEVASTTNEKLLIHHQIEKETDPIKKLYLVNQELEQIRTTVFRQLMFAEFEKVTHETIQKGTPMTGEDFCSLWMDLNRKYFGESIVLDQEIEIEWARIPHFYRDFYVYQYATGYAAASAFAEHILKEGEPAVERYLGFLKTGGSNYPVETLQVAGVDMTSKEPLEATVRRFNVLLDMLEEYLNQ